MMSLPLWLSGPMFFPGRRVHDVTFCLAAWSDVPSGRSGLSHGPSHGPSKGGETPLEEDPL